MRAVILVACTLLLVAFPSATIAQDDASLCVVTDDELAASADATPTPDVESLDGKLGGSRESFMELYGEDDVLAQEGCSSFGTLGSQPGPDGDEIMTIIDIWADRNEDIEAGTLDEPSDANWTVEEATAIALTLLPSDTVLDEPQATEAENLLTSGFSEALADVTTTEQYTFHSSDGEPGEVEVFFGLSSDGTVWNIAVQLGGIA
jgi:hypothetical protein